jgi:hypothetical protein
MRKVISREASRRALAHTAFAVIAAVCVIAGANGAARGDEPQDPIFASGFERSTGLFIPASATPPDASTLAADALPTIGIDFNAPSGRLPPITLSVDGVDVTGKTQIGAGTVRYRPEPALREGTHAVRVRSHNDGVDWTFTTATPPTITDISPTDTAIVSGAGIIVSANYADVGAGIDTSAVRLTVDGTDVTANATVGAATIRYARATSYADGLHEAQLRVVDRAGNATSRTWQFAIGAAPYVSPESPDDGALLPAGTTTPIAATFGGTPIEPASVRLFLDGDDVTAQSTVTMSGANAGTISYTPAAPLAAGQHAAYARASGASGRSGSADWSFIVDTPVNLGISFNAPADGATLFDAEVEAAVRVVSSRGVPEAVAIGGSAATFTSTAGDDFVYTRRVTLAPGTNTLTASATIAGQIREASVTVTYEPLPVVTITSPRDWQAFGPLAAPDAPTPGGARDLTGNVERPVAITGTISRPVASVTINQQGAVLAPDGLSFRFEKFLLHEGTNLLGVVATDAHGRVASANRTLYVDQTAPLVTIEGPAPDSVTSAARIDVRGVVNDAVEAGIGAPEPIVKVKNAANDTTIDATTSDRYYVAADVPLEIGANTLTVTATDAQGNVRRESVRVVRVAAGSRRITVLSGNRQNGAVASALPQPLTIAAIDKDGLPLANLPIRFDVERGTGAISTVQGQVQKPNGVDAARNLVVPTDAAGRASVWLTLGIESTVGGNMVRASNDEVGEGVLFTATGERGEAARIRIDGAAAAQFAATGADPLEPLTALVHDAQNNRVIGATVRYAVTEGDAFFTAESGVDGVIGDEGRSITVRADRNGLATVRPRVGGKPGLVRINATVPLAPDRVIGPAVFQIVALAPRAGPTRFRGVVLDHDGTPLAGVRLSITRTNLSTTSDAAGAFAFDDQVPAGKIDLFIDGRNVHVGTKEYPRMHFEAAVVAGQDNQLPHPVYLPAIDRSLEKIVGGDTDVSLTIPGYDGFEMIVKANSVTFEDGSRVGPMVVTAVNADRLPMVPPGGSATFGSVAWTIQPTNARFDPPVEVKIPNGLGLARGETVPILQWDHDLATFVPMGNGTVCENGTQIVSDRGSGITKAGWGGGPPPPPDNCAVAPPMQCRGAQCNDCGPCKKPRPSNGVETCSDGSCIDKDLLDLITGTPFTVTEPTGTVNIPTKTAEPDDKLFDIKVPQLERDDRAKWKFEAKRTLTIGQQNVECTAEITERELTRGAAEVKNSMLQWASGSTNASGGKMRMVTTPDAKVTIEACGQSEDDLPISKTFATKLENPEPSDVRAYIDSIETSTYQGTPYRVADTLYHFACHEPGAKYRHYKADGTPILNGTNDGGYGMFQTTFKDQPSKLTCQSVWSWRDNVDAGKAIYDGKRSGAVRMAASEKDSPSRSRPFKQCLDALGINENNAPLPPPLGPEQLVFESIRRNNGGRQYRWVPKTPFADSNGCSIGEWQRYLSQEFTPSPYYVEKVCECDTPLMPNGCLHEDVAIYSVTPKQLAFKESGGALPAALVARFAPRREGASVNNATVTLARCELQPVPGHDQEHTDFRIDPAFPGKTWQPGGPEDPVDLTIKFTPSGESRRVRIAQAVCTATQGTPDVTTINLGTLPGGYRAAPAGAVSVATGKPFNFEVTNAVMVRTEEKRLYKSLAWDLNVALSGLAAPFEVAPASAVIEPDEKATFVVKCTNATGVPMSQTLTVAHDGILTPSPATHSVTCDPAQPYLEPFAATTLTGGAGTVPVKVAGRGNAGSSLRLACAIGAGGPAAFAITGGATRTIAGPATIGPNNPAIALSCTPQAAPVTTTLTCEQTPTPATTPPLAALTATITCPAAAPQRSTP